MNTAAKLCIITNVTILKCRQLFIVACLVFCGCCLYGKDAVVVRNGLEMANAAGATNLTTLSGKGLRVLIIGDSMGIGGFSEELDSCFRACPGVTSVHTMVACGSNPLTWMKMAPYGKAATRCGFLRLETVAGQDKPYLEKDFYGMTRGHRPSAHVVPKIEDMLERIKPDIIVFQNGNNFFDFFKKGQIIKEETHGQLIRAHVIPLIRYLANNGSSVRKLYWVSPAQAGNVTPEVQQFIFDSIKHEVIKIGVMLNSREITSYPYTNQARDKMHFWGKAALDWADDIFRLIATDLTINDINACPVLTKRDVAIDTPPATVAKEGTVELRLRLKAKTKVPSQETFFPYGEFLVGYLYDVLEVRAGKYDDKELLILHPAYIKHVQQDLSRYKLKQELIVRVSEIAEDSLWATVRRRDSVGPPELFPYMLGTDLARHPDQAACHDCNQ